MGKLSVCHACDGEAATRDGLADLTHVSMLIETELQALDNQDAAARLGIGPAAPPPTEFANAPPALKSDGQGSMPEKILVAEDRSSVPESTGVNAPEATRASWRPR